MMGADDPKVANQLHPQVVRAQPLPANCVATPLVTPMGANAQVSATE